MGDAARGPMGACGSWTFPKDIGLNEFIPGNVSTIIHQEKYTQEDKITTCKLMLSKT